MEGGGRGEEGERGWGRDLKDRDEVELVHLVANVECLVEVRQQNTITGPVGSLES